MTANHNSLTWGYAGCPGIWSIAVKHPRGASLMGQKCGNHKGWAESRDLIDIPQI